MADYVLLTDAERARYRATPCENCHLDRPVKWIRDPREIKPGAPWHPQELPCPHCE